MAKIDRKLIEDGRNKEASPMELVLENVCKNVELLDALVDSFLAATAAAAAATSVTHLCILMHWKQP